MLQPLQRNETVPPRLCACLTALLMQQGSYSLCAAMSSSADLLQCCCTPIDGGSTVCVMATLITNITVPPHYVPPAVRLENRSACLIGMCSTCDCVAKQEVLFADAQCKVLPQGALP